MRLGWRYKALQCPAHQGEGAQIDGLRETREPRGHQQIKQQRASCHCTVACDLSGKNEWAHAHQKDLGDVQFAIRKFALLANDWATWHTHSRQWRINCQPEERQHVPRWADKRYIKAKNSNQVYSNDISITQLLYSRTFVFCFRSIWQLTDDFTQTISTLGSKKYRFFILWGLPTYYIFN